ncbi:hypothetical protein PMAYCL1PPCAC_29377, partial [Pristionchus mayeri]
FSVGMADQIRRTFPKKPAPGTPFRSPIAKFRRDQEKWSKERMELKQIDSKEEYGMKKKMESLVGGRYFDAGQKEEERKQKIEERRANKKMMKEEGRKAKMELKVKKRDVNKEKKKEMRKGEDIGEVKMKMKKIVKKRKPSMATEESDDPESEEEKEMKQIDFILEYLPHLGESDMDSEDLPEEDMYGNEKEEDQNGIMKKDEEEEDEDSEPENPLPQVFEKLMCQTLFVSYATGVIYLIEDEEENEKREEEEEMEGDEEEEEEEGEEDSGMTLTDLQKFREEMASLPLSKVREVKEKLGIKLFNDAFFGRDEKKKEKIEENLTKRSFKRENSKRPREISSKKGASRFRPIYKEKKTIRLDPRFDDRCGAFNEVIYDTNYGFLDELRTEEVKKMKKDVGKAKKEGDGERVAQLREDIIREENRFKAKREKEMRMSAMKELKKENMERMKKGLQPKFIKRSEVKMKIMEKKFDQLKEDNQLDKYLRRKAKKESRKGSSGKGGGPKLGV